MMRASAPNEDRSFFLLPTMKMASDCFAPEAALPQMRLLITRSRLSTIEGRFISDRRARWSLCKRQQNRSQCGGGLLGPHLLVDHELKVRKPRQPLVYTENAQARDQRAGRKRGDGEARERRRATRRDRDSSSEC
jgi:hypothetical protein